MATGGRLRDSDVPDIYSCAVCMEHLLDRNPRFLSCHHSFCQQCLQKLTNNGQVSCPTCRAITAVHNNDVTKLTMNFQLVQIMEREQEFKLERPTTLSSPKCMFCSSQASYKCRECRQFLCKTCKIKHKQRKTFKSHGVMEISQLCQEHLEFTSHVCMQCIQALCIKCVALDHEDHEHQVEEYRKGMKKFKAELDKMNNKLKLTANMIQKHQNKICVEKSDTAKKVKDLQIKKDALLEQIKEINKELVDASGKMKNLDNDVTVYEKLYDEYVVISRNIDWLQRAPYKQILLSFKKQERLIENIFSKTDMTELTEEVEWLVTPFLKTDLDSIAEFKIEYPNSIKAIGSNLAVYSDFGTSKIVVFDNTGTQKRSFEGVKEYGQVRGVGVFKNYLYLAQEKMILCIINFNTSNETRLKFVPRLSKIFKIAVANENSIICTDKEEGKVYEYNTEDDTTKTVLQGLRHPSNISVDHTPDGTRYILTLSGQSVNVYNESWQLLTTISEGINYPCDTVPCPGGFLLADHDSDKITLYSYTGDIVRTVLTEKDGLYGPVSISVTEYGYIWVGETFQSFDNLQMNYVGQLKCFEIFK